MPQTVRWFIRTSAVYLALTFLLGAVFLYCRWQQIPLDRTWSVVHMHMGLVGWLVNIVMGVALWMFPLNKEAFPAGGGRYRTWQARYCYFALNIGLAARLVSEPVFFYKHEPAWGAVMTASGVLQLSAAGVFMYIVFKRVRKIAGLKANP